jgi:methyl-accepting chemotaxis protein
MEPAALPTSSPAPAAPPPREETQIGASPAHSAKRRVRNYLLDKPLQLRLASYLLAAAATLSLGLGALLYQAYRETSRVIALGDPDVGDSIERALAREDRLRIVLLAAAIVVVLLLLLAAAVVITHRIAGPAVVLGRMCRQVGEGRLARPRPLRSRDLLVDLADDIAAMVDSLRDREGKERDAIQAAVATLRDPDAGPAAHAAAAVELERLASDKEARLRS